MAEKAKTGESDGKVDAGTLDRLYALAKARDPLADACFKENAMNHNHYKEFRKTAVTSPRSEVQRTESYVTVSSLNPDRSFACFVVGVDDTTNKLFCHRLPDNSEDSLGSDKDVRKAMGFDTESIELDKWIRVQGDLTMKIHEQAETPERLLSYLAKTELFRHIEDYSLDVSSNELDSIVAKAAVYDNDISDQDYNLVCRMLKANGMGNELELIKSVRGKEGSGPTVHRIVRMLQGQDAYRNDLRYLEKNRARVMQREYDMATSRENRYTFMQAHHKITLTASFVRNARAVPRRQMLGRTILYILRPSVITIEHEEHGKREIMIDRPSMLEFGFLNRYDAQVRRHPEGIRAQRRRQELELMEAAMARDREARMMTIRELDLQGRRLRGESRNIGTSVLSNMNESRVDEFNVVLGIIERLDQEGPNGADMNRVAAEAQRLGMHSDAFNNAVHDLEFAGDIYRPREGFLRRTGSEDQ